MNFDEIKERIVSSLKQIWDRVQDSSAFNRLRDRFENLTPRMQKGVVAGAAFVVSLIILSIPYGSWKDSSTAVGNFEDRRDLVRKLLKTSRDTAEVPDAPQAPAPEALKTDIDTQLKEMQLLPEQIHEISVTTSDSKLIPSGSALGAVSVNLAKLNLRQIVDIGYKLKAISPSVKMTSMIIFPNQADARYFDASFKLISLSIPQMAAVPAEPEEPVKKPSFKKPKTKKGDDD